MQLDSVMKKKTSRLSLRKETLRDLSTSELHNVDGGSALRVNLNLYQYVQVNAYAGAFGYNIGNVALGLGSGPRPSHMTSG